MASTQKSNSQGAAAENPEQPAAIPQLADVVADVLERSSMWLHESLPFQACLSVSSPRLVFMAGPNATGKSFLARIVQGFGRAYHNTSPIHVSMTERTGSGLADMASMRRAMMFGDESEHSTGTTSAKTVGSAMYNAAQYAKEGKSSLLVLDEPEIGLSEGYAFALGELIARKTQELPPNACGVLVVSHSKPLARGLCDGLGQEPSFVYTGSGSKSLDEWLEQSERFSVEELQALPTVDHERWRAVLAVEQEFSKS